MSGTRENRRYMLDLYNSFGGIAEQVEHERLRENHIPTNLDDHLAQWVARGQDVILTGNPGDGKTHLIKVLEDTQRLSSAVIETDASQKQASAILVTWQQAREQGKPFVLAVNHAPLRRLAEQSGTFPMLNMVTSIPQTLRYQVVYSEEDNAPLSDLSVIVDLSKRELLVEEIVRPLTTHLVRLATSEPCPDCPPGRCPIEYNAQALSNFTVRNNLLQLFSLVSQQGTHATMRDLAALFAYALMGSRDCNHRWAAQPDEDGKTTFPAHESCAYYNLLFEGRGTLFDALRRFDPGTLADPVDDLKLWHGEITTGWLFEVPLAPNDLAALRRLKRRYFFEQDHTRDGHLNRLLPEAVQAFDRLVSKEVDAQNAVEELVAMINTFFAPGAKRDHAYRLRLWNSHRYATGEAPAFFAMRALPADKLTLYHPRLAPPLADAMSLRQDHVLLGVRDWRRGNPALRVDWPLYQALIAARKGRPLALQPFQVVRRLDLFLRSLGQDVGGSRSVEQIEWSEQPDAVRVNRSTRRYERPA